jgi:hypothetical protein
MQPFLITYSCIHYRATISHIHHSADVRGCSYYDVIGNQAQYEVIRKEKGGDATTKKDNKFTLSECPAYGPVGTPASQVEQRGERSAEYEVVQITSSA